MGDIQLPAKALDLELARSLPPSELGIHLMQALIFLLVLELL